MNTQRATGWGVSVFKGEFFIVFCVVQQYEMLVLLWITQIEYYS